MRPYILSFSSVVDTTSSTSAVIEDLYKHLANEKNELVLFDINRGSDIAHLIGWKPPDSIQRLLQNSPEKFTTTVVSNQQDKTKFIKVIQTIGGQNFTTVTNPSLSCRFGVFSLSHVALSFPPDDPLYGVQPLKKAPEAVLEMWHYEESIRFLKYR